MEQIAQANRAESCVQHRSGRLMPSLSDRPYLPRHVESLTPSLSILSRFFCKFGRACPIKSTMPSCWAGRPSPVESVGRSLLPCLVDRSFLVCLAESLLPHLAGSLLPYLAGSLLPRFEPVVPSLPSRSRLPDREMVVLPLLSRSSLPHCFFQVAPRPSIRLLSKEAERISQAQYMPLDHSGCAPGKGRVYRYSVHHTLLFIIHHIQYMHQKRSCKTS